MQNQGRQLVHQRATSAAQSGASRRPRVSSRRLTTYFYRLYYYRIRFDHTFYIFDRYRCYFFCFRFLYKYDIIGHGKEEKKFVRCFSKRVGVSSCTFLNFKLFIIRVISKYLIIRFKIPKKKTKDQIFFSPGCRHNYAKIYSKRLTTLQK